MNGEFLKQQLQKEREELAEFTALRYKIQREKELKRQENLIKLEKVLEKVKQW